MTGRFDKPDFYSACDASLYNKAVSKIDIEYKGNRIRAEIVKPRNGDGWIHFEQSGIRIRKATSKEIDSRKRWDPY